MPDDARPFIDISLPLHRGTPTYPGDPAFRAVSVARVEEQGYAMQALAIGTHTGTHVDAPAHFFGGGLTVERLPPEILCGPARVVDVRDAGARVERDVLAGLDLAGVRRLLLRTANEARTPDRGTPVRAGLTAAAARYLCESTEVQLLGTDGLSIEVDEGDRDFPVHRTLLGATPPVLLLEGLDLSVVEPGGYELLCLPLRIVAADGAPARAVLRVL